MSPAVSKQPAESTKYLRMIASIKVAEKKRLSQTIVPRWNSHGLSCKQHCVGVLKSI
jgi:hypothetical protein